MRKGFLFEPQLPSEVVFSRKRSSLSLRGFEINSETFLLIHFPSLKFPATHKPEEYKGSETMFS